MPALAGVTVISAVGTATFADFVGFGILGAAFGGVPVASATISNAVVKGKRYTQNVAAINRQGK